MKRFVFVLSLLLFVGFSLLQGQGVQVTGNVTGAEDGAALPGVSVVVRGTTIGAVTDFEGNYSITVPDESATLMFSFVGMVTQEMALEGRTVIDIVMESSATELDEVVVTALGIKRERREVTYQTQKVLDDELTAVSPTRVAEGLVGKVAGLQINVQDNGVNPRTQVILRGLRSVTGNNSALIVIDGSVVTRCAFDDLNPDDIANISVLKGATAAALYGSDASNGALLVTTKSGAAGKKMTVGFDLSYTIEDVAYMPRFQTEYGTGWEGAYDNWENTNWGPRFDGTMRQVGPDFPNVYPDYPVETQIIPYAPVQDNLLHFFENGDTWNNTVYISGSRENSQFYISFGDQRADGIIPQDEYKRNTVRVNASKRVGKVEVAVNTSFKHDYTNVVGSTIGDQDRPLYWFILNTSANIPLEDYWDWDNPLSYGYANNYYNGYYQNPYWGVGTNRNIDYTNRFIGNFNVSWDILEWLNFTTRVGANTLWGKGLNWRARQEYDAELEPYHTTVSSFVEDSQFQLFQYTGDALLTGNFNFGELFTLKAILGASVVAGEQSDMMIRANNLSIPDFYDVSNGTGTPEIDKDDSQKRVMGFYGDLTFGIGNFIFLNLSGRNDWTSTLSADNNSYFYPGMGLSFVFTDAIPGLKDNDIFSFGKLTVSNSTVYNDLRPYRINEIYEQGTGFPFGSVNGFSLSNTAVDANITKEKINTQEIGLNLGFLNGRIWFDGAVFITKTTDLITFTTPSRASGSTQFLTNIGELKGHGLELSLGGSVLKMANGLQWDVNVNYTRFETIVEEIYEGLDEIALGTSGQYGVYAVKGEAFPQLKANIYQRDPQGRIIVDPASGHPLTETGLANMGKTVPDYILGLNSIFRFKGISASITYDYRTGHVYFAEGANLMEFTGRSLESVSANRQDFVIPNSVIEVSDGVYVENTNIEVQGGRQSYWTDVYNDVKSNYVWDASAAKIREIAISYTLPPKILEKTPLSKVTVGFIARNPFTWLPPDNVWSDPEFNNTGEDRRLDHDFTDNENIIGIGGYYTNPPTRSFGFNVNIEF